MLVNMSYKEAHEAFVTGHAGTSTLEIAILVSCAPASVLVRYAVSQVFHKVVLLDQRLKFIVDFLVLMMPMIFCFTTLADSTLTFLVMMIILAVSLLTFTSHRVSNSKAMQIQSLLDAAVMAGRRPFLTNYRSFVNAATAVSILAVDFTIFPRRFCKTETYGTGLMDVGVAAYIFSNALVSSEARQSHNLKTRSIGMVVRVLQSIKSTGPLWVLGLCRLITVKSSGYHEHVTEYGVHWNFFFTLAVVRVLSTMLFCVIDVRLSWLLAATVISGYQLVLSIFGLTEYILNDDGSRVGWFEANREGICSCLGYMALYFAGVQLGRFIMQPRSQVREWLMVLGILVAVDAIVWLLLVMSEALIDRVSRRLANLSYALWMIAYNIQSLASFLAVEIMSVVHAESQQKSSVDVPAHRSADEDSKEQGTNLQAASTSCYAATDKDCCNPSFDLLDAINRNGLLYFLLANLLTGVVNLATPTMYATACTAFVQLTIYMLTLSVAAAILHIRNISVKFW